jgi:TolB-like protein/DNA-binding winged helix-turn-helix (wHTH) protein/Flp pilus assembly protein TadD
LAALAAEISREDGIRMSAGRYLIGESTLDLSLGRLCRNGTEIALRPKSFALLQYLVTHAGRLITKDELLSKIWPGVVVTEDSLTRCVSEVRAALGDTDQTMIKTVSRRGYAFVGPVTKLDDDPVVLPAADALVPAKRDVASRRWVLAMIAIFVLAGGVWYSLLRPQQSNVLPRLSLVVLPFANLNGDPTQDYLGDIVTGDLTTALSRLRGSTVIAAASALTLKGKIVDIKQVGREFGVRYAVEGSVLRSDGSLRINARLVDTQTLTTLWSDRFDVNRTDLLRTQDEIVARLASALQGELIQAEVSRSPNDSASNVDAEDLAMQCEASAYRLSGEVTTPHLDFCERALRIDPRNVRALVRLATYYGSRVSRVQSLDREADLEQANALLSRALEIDPGYYAAHCTKATILEGRRRVSDGIAAAEHCLALNPSSVDAYRALAILNFFLARPEQILAYVDRGTRLSPRDPATPIFLLFKGWAYFLTGRDDEALVWLRRAAAASPETPVILAALASQLALAGQDAEARATLARYLALPATRTRTVAQWDYVPDDNPAFAQFHQRFRSGLRRAGMPEE